MELTRYFTDIEAEYPVREGIKVIAGHPQQEFVKAYIQRYDADFYEPLSARVDLEAFSQKLSELSTTFIIFKDGEPAGLICSYFYNPESKKGFITLVHTRHRFRGQHLAVYLLDAIKAYARQHAFESIDLYVSKQQTSAYQLYLRHGFSLISEEENGRCLMCCQLNIENN